MNNVRRQKLNKSLKQIVSAIVAQYEPEKVILFGSLAQGKTSEWSDLDLVIIKDTPLPFTQRSKEVALLCPVWVGVDYLVYTPEEFDQMIAERNPFILNEVLQKGKVLYERQPAVEMAG
ncbi:MAG TPA: nucleotidyltransferase domain-containing protein [Chloroflexota bacterium]|nr:nucleotidyltransferase domain-containing protein [Chloroflexota bacterium]